MDVFHIIFGAAAGTAGGAALVQSVRRAPSRPFVSRLLLFIIGVAFATYGVFHCAEGLGAAWATPKLRSDLYFWFFAPCFIIGLVVWIAERRS